METAANCAVNVFAYGSNLHVGRMLKRVPSARRLVTGFVKCRRLIFHKRSRDGSAKADAALTEVESDRVWGVVYEINSEQKRVLDQHEFLGIGYDEELVEVMTVNDRIISAWMYFARSEAIEAGLEPYKWYRDFIVQGAVQHRLPYCYIQSRLDVSSRDDPDPDRRSANQALLGR